MLFEINIEMIYIYEKKASLTIDKVRSSSPVQGWKFPMHMNTLGKASLTIHSSKIIFKTHSITHCENIQDSLTHAWFVSFFGSHDANLRIIFPTYFLFQNLVDNI